MVVDEDIAMQSTNVVSGVNGLIINGYYIPEELLINMLTYINVDELIKLRMVCRFWNEMIDKRVFKEKTSRKSRSFSKLNEKEIAKLHLPWYLYYTICKSDPFNTNLLENHCGQDTFEHWNILAGRINRDPVEWVVEPVPCGADTLPENCDDFGDHSSCFATSYILCKKEQVIILKDKGLPGYIMDTYQPTIVISEWYAGRFDCSCIYRLKATLNDEVGVCIITKNERREVKQWEGKEWHKVEITFDNYGPNVRQISFCHAGKDELFWAGHYGSKMSGGVVKVLLPLDANMASESYDI